MTAPGPWKGKLRNAVKQAGVLICAGCMLAGCSSGGNAISYDPAEDTPTRIESSDGQMIAVIPAGALDATAELSLVNRSDEDGAIPGPEGRSLVMAMEFTASQQPVDEEPEDDGNGDPENTPSQTPADDPAELSLAEAAEITWLLPAALPAAMSIPLYTFNAVSRRYEDAELSATVSGSGLELVFSLDRFGRFAYYNLLPGEIPPPAPGGPALAAASTQVRKLEWSAPANAIIAGVNLYRASAGSGSFTKLNTDPLTTTVYSDELPDSGAYEYYITAQNTAGLESEPSATVQSPAVDFDIISSWGWDRMIAPGDLAIGPGGDTLLICDPGLPGVWVYSLDGRYQRRITSHLGKELLAPTGVAVNPGGDRVYITDALRQRVNIYGADLEPVTFFGTGGSGPGEFQRPAAIEVIHDAELIGDVVLVADSELSTLQSFTGLGVYLDTVASSGTEDGQLSTPGALMADHSSGSLYISDSEGNRIQVFSADLEFESSIVLLPEANGPLSLPLGLARDFRERLYAADSGNRRVVVFDSSDERLFHFGADGDLRMEFSDLTGPQGLALDPSTGYLYVSDTGNRRIVVFSS